MASNTRAALGAQLRISFLAVVALLLTLAVSMVSASDAGVSGGNDGAAEPLLRRAKRVEAIPVSYPKAGLLHNYQFLSPGLLLAVLVMGALVGPLVLFVVARLSEVAAPDRLGAEPRKAPGSDKKSQ